MIRPFDVLTRCVTGDEAVSGLYRYRVECLSPDDGVELKSLLGLPARLGLQGQDGGDVVLCGVVTVPSALRTAC